jgi:hypothetical protein
MSPLYHSKVHFAVYTHFFVGFLSVRIGPECRLVKFQRPRVAVKQLLRSLCHIAVVIVNKSSDSLVHSLGLLVMIEAI